MFEDRPSSLDWLMIGRLLHEALAAMAVLWLALLFLDNWHHRSVMPYPVAALALAVILALGSTLARASMRSMSRVIADDDVAELLDVAYSSTGASPDPVYQQSSLQRLLPLIMSVQIAATAGIGLYLMISIQTGGPPPAPSATITPPSAIASAPASVSALPTASTRPVSDPEWQTWPAIAAIALSELTYLGWMFEGEAAVQELIAISRRWSRRRSDTAPKATENVKTESDPPETVAERSAASGPLPGPARRARAICKLLARYGVDLVPRDSR